MRGRARAWIACWLGVALGCGFASSGCSTETRLRQGGPTPYVRCLGGPAPSARTLHLGHVSLASKERRLELAKDGPSVGAGKDTLLVAVFSGAGFGAGPNATELAALAASQADLFLMLGGLGDTDQLAEATANALATLKAPVIFVAGGRDSWDRVSHALGSSRVAEHVLDASPLRELRFGSLALVPIAGSETGRYSVDQAGCGFSASDLAGIARELGRPAEHVQRWLVSWQTPANAGVRTRGGVDAGSFMLADFARRVGTSGRVSAFPGLPLPDDSSQLSAPRAFGPRAENVDGAIASVGLRMITLDAAGSISVAARPAASGEGAPLAAPTLPKPAQPAP